MASETTTDLYQDDTPAYRVYWYKAELPQDTRGKCSLAVRGYVSDSSSPSIRYPINVSLPDVTVEAWVAIDAPICSKVVHRVPFFSGACGDLVCHGPYAESSSFKCPGLGQLLPRKEADDLTRCWLRIEGVNPLADWDADLISSIHTRVLAHFHALVAAAAAAAAQGPGPVSLTDTEAEGPARSGKIVYSTLPVWPTSSAANASIKIPKLDAHETLLRIFPTACVPGFYSFPHNSFQGMNIAKYISREQTFTFHQVTVAEFGLLFNRSSDMSNNLDEPMALAARYAKPFLRLTYAVLKFRLSQKAAAMAAAGSAALAGNELEVKFEPAYWLYRYNESKPAGSVEKFPSAIFALDQRPRQAQLADALLELSKIETKIHFIVFSLSFDCEATENLFLAKDDVKYLSDTGGFRCVAQLSSAMGFSCPSSLRVDPAWQYVPARELALALGSGLKSVSKTAAIMAEIAQISMASSLSFYLWKERALKVVTGTLTKRFLREGYSAIPWPVVYNARVSNPQGLKGGDNKANQGVYFDRPTPESEPDQVIANVDYKAYYPSIAIELGLCLTQTNTAWQAVTASKDRTAIKTFLLKGSSVQAVSQRALAEAMGRGDDHPLAEGGAECTPHSFEPLPPLGNELAYLITARSSVGEYDQEAAKAFKKVTNGIIGALQTRALRYFCPDLSQHVTLYGRELIQLTREIFESALGAEIISSVTDSITFRSARGKPVLSLEQMNRFCRSIQRQLALSWIKISPPEFYDAICVFATNRMCWLKRGATGVKREQVRGTAVVSKSERVTPHIRETWLLLYSACLRRDRAAIEDLVAKARSQEDPVAFAVCEASDGKFLLGSVFPDLSIHSKRIKFNPLAEQSNVKFPASSGVTYWDSTLEIRKFFGIE